LRTFLLTALSIPLALALAAGAPRTVRAQDTTQVAVTPLAQALTRIRVLGHERDSLARLADQDTGEQRAVREEQVWQMQLAIQASILEVSAKVEQSRADGGDQSALRPVLEDALAAGWPRYQRQLERRERLLKELFERRDTANPQQRLEIETRFAADSDRLARMYRDLLDMLAAAERESIDVTQQRTDLSEKVGRMAEQARVRMVVLGRSQALVASRVQRKPDDTEAQLELEATTAAFNQTTQNLETEIALLKRMGKDVTELKVALIVARGTLTPAIFESGVIPGLVRYGQGQLMELLARQGPRWLFQGLMIVFIFAGFGLLARLTRSMVRRAIATAGISTLMKDTIVGWSSRLVGLIGLVVLLRQFGVQLGPMLTGLGIAGFVVGFALQDTLANFAAGGMILAYHPYDIGDVVEAGGAVGTVKKMSLVSTTILSFDNQTLIVPNKKMWGDVIRNMTSQHTRRVDLMFATGYENDVATIERLLQEIAQADERVLKEPAPVIKLHQLAESSVNFIVRVWTRQEDYWDVYWDITRAVKLRFDQEGIKIPFPQRELHVNMIGGRTDGPA